MRLPFRPAAWRRLTLAQGLPGATFPSRVATIRASRMAASNLAQGLPGATFRHSDAHPYIGCMANTYTQLGIHIVTAVKHRAAIIDREWLPEIYAVSASIVQDRKHQVLAIGGEPDHLHIFLDIHPTDSISHLVGAWKSQVSGFISGRYGTEFEFQRGYGAFAVSKRDWPRIKNYVNNQYEHHNGLPFREEYIDLLKENEIEYDDRYLFMWIDED